jgi:hypothetical protein
MQVRMLVDISGTRNGQPWPRIGGTIELPDDEAAGYVAAGLAEIAGTVEQASDPAPARAERAAGRR